MKNQNLRLAVALAAILVPRVAGAQHQTHQPGAAQAVHADCARAQPVVDNLITGAMARLETSRQSNDPAEMRAAVDHLQAALRDIRTQLAPCSAAAAADPHAGHPMPGAARPAAPSATPPGSADPHAGHSGTPAKPAAPASKGAVPASKGATAPKPSAPSDPHAGHGAPSRPEPAAKTEKVRDPVTGLMVDPATAPQTTYQNQTYYFSSEQSRKEFLANPAKFVKKPKG